MPLLRFFSAFVIVAAVSATSAQNAPQPRLPTIKLNAGIHLVTAEVASTPMTRATGLMWRQRLEPNHGMLFVFEQRGPHCFWMRNTLIPLSIAFIEDDGTIVGISEMAPKTDTGPCAPRPVSFALEMERGWFAKRGIAAGAKIGGLPSRASGAVR